VTLPTCKADALHADIGVVDKCIRSGVTAKRANATDKHWGHWEQFCLDHNVDPYLQAWEDPVPIVQVFGERYRNGRLAPLHNTVKYRTVEEALRAVGQAHARLGGPDPRKDHHGDILGSRTRDHSKGKPGLVEKDIRSSGSGDLQPGKKEVFTISDHPRGKTKSHPSFTSLLQNNLFRETVFSLLQLDRKQENRDYRMESTFQHYSVEVKED
jgi:hypothetical protein